MWYIIRTVKKNHLALLAAFIIFFLLIIALAYFYYSRDNFFRSINTRENDVSRGNDASSFDAIVEQKNSDDADVSVFHDYVKETSDVDDQKLTEKYRLGEDEYLFIFESYGDSRIIVKDSTNKQDIFSVTSDCLLFCQKDKVLVNGQEIDNSRICMNYSQASERALEQIITYALRIPNEKKAYLLSKYPAGNPIRVGFENYSKNVNIITIYLEDPTICDQK